MGIGDRRNSGKKIKLLREGLEKGMLGLEELYLEEGDNAFLESLVERVVKGKGKKSGLKYGNIIEWIVYGLGVESIYSEEYREQYHILVEFFDLLCEKCNKDKSDGRNVRKDVLMKIDLKEGVLRCEKCGSVKERMKYDTLVVCAGMRSGKTVLAGFIASWIFYLVSEIEGIEKRFGLVSGQRLRVSMVATAGAQTEKTVWGAFEALLKGCADVEVREMVDRLSRGEDKEMELKGKLKEWRIGNVEFLCLHSNSGSLAGGTGILGILEEYSRFNIGMSARSAREVYRVVRNSLQTVRVKVKNYVDGMFGLLVVVSSPFYTVGDPVLSEIYGENYWEKEEGFRIGERWSEGRRYMVHKATWQFNKGFKEEDFEEEKKRDYYGVMRDYGADPRQGRNLFFEDMGVVHKAIVKGYGLWFREIVRKEGAVDFISAECVGIGECFGRKYVVHVDLGEKKDLMAMAFARLDKDGIVWVDGLLVLRPDGGRRVWLETPIEMLRFLKDRVLLDYVSYDQWQSYTSIQKLMEWGVNSGRRSVGEVELYMVKRLLYDGELKILDSKYSDGYSNGVKELLLEAKSLEVVDGKVGHCDVWIAVAGAVVGAKYGIAGKKDIERKMDSIKRESFNKIAPVSFRGRW